MTEIAVSSGLVKGAPQLGADGLYVEPFRKNPAPLIVMTVPPLLGPLDGEMLLILKQPQSLPPQLPQLSMTLGSLANAPSQP